MELCCSHLLSVSSRKSVLKSSQAATSAIVTTRKIKVNTSRRHLKKRKDVQRGETRIQPNSVNRDSV